MGAVGVASDQGDQLAPLGRREAEHHAQLMGGTDETVIPAAELDQSIGIAHRERVRIAKALRVALGSEPVRPGGPARNRSRSSPGWGCVDSAGLLPRICAPAGVMLSMVRLTRAP